MEGYMLDGSGNWVAIANIRPIDLARDDLVKEKIVKIKALHVELKALKQELINDVDAFVNMSLEQYGVKLGGRKGNVSLSSFDGKYQIARQISETLVFDERLQAVKVLIDECLREWTRDSGSEIRTLVEHAFRVDKKGKLNTAAILSLGKLDIKHEKWQMAMKAMQESLSVSGSCEYIRAYELDENGKPQAISLDFASL